MKTEQEVRAMLEGVQKKIDECQKMALAQSDYDDAKIWFESSLRLMAQRSILLEVLK